jgi:hypothetical protein
MSTLIQNYKSLENVNPDSMNNFYLNKDQKVTAYFPDAPAICSGIGDPSNSFGQIGTTNQFNFLAGEFRFVDQANSISASALMNTTVDYPATTVTVSTPAGPPQYYIAAQVTISMIDSFNANATCAILSAAQTWTTISANPTMLAICTITNTSGVYSVGFDDNCATNYGFSPVNSDFPMGVRSLTTSTYTVSTFDSGFYLGSISPTLNCAITFPPSANFPSNFMVCIGDEFLAGSTITVTDSGDSITRSFTTTKNYGYYRFTTTQDVWNCIYIPYRIDILSESGRSFIDRSTDDMTLFGTLDVNIVDTNHVTSNNEISSQSVFTNSLTINGSTLTSYVGTASGIGIPTGAPAQSVFLYAQSVTFPTGTSFATVTLPPSIPFTRHPTPQVTMAIPGIGADSGIYVISAVATGFNAITITLSGAPSISDVVLNLTVVGN